MEAYFRMRFSRYLTAVVLFGLLLVPAVLVYGQATSEDVSNRRAELRQELSELEKEIEKQRQILAEKQRETNSLERDIAVFNAKIRQAELSVRARNLRIQELESEINAKEQDITSLSDKMNREKESLAQLMRKTRAMDEYSLLEIVLSNQNISEFFGDIKSFAAINQSLNQSFEQIEETKEATKEEREALAKKRGEQEELRHIQELQKRRLEQAKAEKRRLLERTKGQEERYREIVEAKEKSAAEIRSELFALRGSDSIPFEKALRYANEASQETGVRPALILGIIAEESNLGENVGTCSYKGNMKEGRDVPIFLEITKRLGLNPNSVPVSCKPWYGYGGAMGPAQFIPSTWVIIEDRVAKLTGNTPPNPWNPEDAFMAAALLLRDNGAAKGTYYAERLAALRYFAGWRNATKPAYAFYGDDVMNLAAKYQKQIDILGGN